MGAFDLDAPDSSIGAPKKAGNVAHKPKRVMMVWHLSAIAYVAVCAGPFGIESAIQAAGAFPTILGILLLPILYGFPQALMVAELSSMCKENGGYVHWVRHGMGEFPCWVSSWNHQLSNFFDITVYCMLFASYMQTMLPTMTEWQVFGLEAVSLTVVALVNLTAMDKLSLLCTVLTAAVLTPFVVEPFMVLPDIRENAGALLESTKGINWTLLISVLLWNYQGWDTVGCFSGEVKGKKTYPLAMALALLFVTLTYLIAVCVGVCIEPDFSKWEVGYLSVAASRASPWLGKSCLSGFIHCCTP
jgi:polyamine:H+ symporter